PNGARICARSRVPDPRPRWFSDDGLLKLDRADDADASRPGQRRSRLGTRAWGRTSRPRPRSSTFGTPVWRQRLRRATATLVQDGEETHRILDAGVPNRPRLAPAVRRAHRDSTRVARPRPGSVRLICCTTTTRSTVPSTVRPGPPWVT